MRFRSLILWLFAATIFAGCSRTPPSAAPGDGKSAETGVTVGKALKKTLRRVIEQPGTIEAFEEAPLVARIPGYVDKVHADIGKRVKGPAAGKPGELLAELAVPDMLEELKQKKELVNLARAEVDQARASLDAANAHVQTSQAMVREAEAARARAEANFDRWKSEFKRVEDLVASKIVDRQIRDETLNQYKAAEANRQEVDAKVQSAEAMKKESEAKSSKAKADVEAAKARVQVALAEEGRLAALVEFRNIRAPFDGVVTRRNISTGHFLQPNASGGPGVLFQVARTDTLRISADIPESDAGYLADGMTAKIEAPVLKEQTFAGKVTRTSWTLDSKSRTLRVEIDYPNPESKLRPGMFVNILFTVEFPDRLTLPATAIFTHSDQACCYRVENGKTVRTPLKLGVRDGQAVEVLRKQTREGVWESVTGEEEIVLTNLGAVTEGKELPTLRK